MKKIFVLIVALCILISNIAFAVSPVILAEFAYTASAGYDEHLLFLWVDPSSTTVDFSKGDNTGSATGTVEITGGAVVTTDTGSDGRDFYSFDVSNGDILSTTEGTIVERFMITSCTTHSAPTSCYVDVSNSFKLEVSNTIPVDLHFYFTGSGSTENVYLNSNLSLSTYYWARISWQTISPYIQVEIYEDSSGDIGASIISSNNTSSLPTFSVAPSINDLIIGNSGSYAGVWTITDYAIYDDFRSTNLVP